MYDERGNIVNVAGPSTPVSVLGLDGAATAGDKFNVFEDEKKKTNCVCSQLMRNLFVHNVILL
jgi:translation initiation factor IF-2